jgi:hypothetical protein
LRGVKPNLRRFRTLIAVKYRAGTTRSTLPTSFHGEAAGFEEGEEAVGEFPLEFEGAVFDFSAAAEGGFQFVEQVFEFCLGPRGGKSFEDEDSFAAAVGGGAAEEEAFFDGRAGGLARPFGGWRTRGPRVPALFGKFAALDFERGEGIGPQFRRGLRGDTLFVLPRHVDQRSQRFFLM